MLSWLILIDRGFNPKLLILEFDDIHYLSFQRIISQFFLSDDSEEGTPGSIPNPEVKLFSAEDSSFAKIGRC